MKFTVEPESIPKRLDVYLVEQLDGKLSRGYIQRLIDDGKATHKGKIARSNQIVKEGDLVELDYSEDDLKIPDIELPIIYEDDNVIVIDKPIGVLSHSKGAFNPEATVDSFTKSKLTDITDDRGGIVHRLDRATSGVMIVAKNQETRKLLQKQFADRKTKKSYLAVIEGDLEQDEAIIDLPIERSPITPSQFRIGPQGKTAQTHYQVLNSDGTYTLLKLMPKTGRTHQLRVHLDYLKRPIVGDTLYGGKKASRMMLHASELEITIPKGQRITFKSSNTDPFSSIIKNDA